MSNNTIKTIHGIYALCDQSYRKDLKHVEIAEQLLAGGISILQLRMKAEKDLLKVRQTTESILALKKKYSFTFILNDFVELGVELGVDGIHVGQEDMDLQLIRKFAGDKILIGYSSHSLMEAKTAAAKGADYVALGAIFPTATKGAGHPVVGVETLKKVVSNIKIPTVAIGGINESNFDQVKATGVAAIAMIGALTNVTNITLTAKNFVEKWS